MKKLSLLLSFLFSVAFANAQSTTSVPPYLKEPVIIPPFKLLLGDSTYFTKQDLPKKKFIVIIYFSPTCGHCQDQAKELAKNMGKFKNVFFVMGTSEDLSLIKEFGEDFGLAKFSNVKMGRDLQYFLPTFYEVRQTPFTAVYSKKGKFLKAFPTGFTIEELEKLVK